MSKIKLHFVFALFFVFYVCMILMSCSMERHSVFQKANIYDHEIFSQAVIEHSEDPFRFYFSPLDIHKELNAWRKQMEKKKYKTFEEFMEDTKSVSFIVIRNDSILYENYFNGISRDSLIGVFSISKSVVGLLAGVAFDHGMIKSLNTSVSNYIPEYSKDTRKDVTLFHVMNMTSGFNSSDFTHIGKIEHLYYEDNLEAYIKNMSMKFRPGSEFIYKSFDTQVLGFCLEKVYQEKLYKVLEEKLWKPLQMEYNATWNLDRYLGNEKMFGGLNMHPIDLAKIGRLMLNHGKWNNQQVISEQWVQECFARKKENGRSVKYSRGWWQTTRKNAQEARRSDDLLAIGLRGQYLYLHPTKNIIIIRQGTDKGDINWDYEFYKLCEKL